MAGHGPVPHQSGLDVRYMDAGSTLFDGTGLAYRLRVDGTSLATNRDVPVTVS